MSQDQTMMYCPATGAAQPFPSHAQQWRDHHGKTAWLFNPWTGDRRSAMDVGTDIQGRAIVIAVVAQIHHVGHKSNA